MKCCQFIVSPHAKDILFYWDSEQSYSDLDPYELI